MPDHRGIYETNRQKTMTYGVWVIIQKWAKCIRFCKQELFGHGFHAGHPVNHYGKYQQLLVLLQRHMHLLQVPKLHYKDTSCLGMMHGNSDNGFKYIRRQVICDWYIDLYLAVFANAELSIDCWNPWMLCNSHLRTHVYACITSRSSSARIL